MNRDFKGVWIPREIYLANDLSWSEKILLIEIDSLDNDPKKGCYASNQYLAEFMNLSTGRIANIISGLKATGYIKQLFFDGHNRGLRTIFHGRNLNKIVKVNLHENVKEPSRKRESEPSRFREHNNTKKNNTRERKEYTSTHASGEGLPPHETERPDASDWPWPVAPLIAAFPDYLAARLTPAMAGFYEAEVLPGDEAAWEATIRDYRMNFNIETKSYLPDKPANVLSVFRKYKAEANKGTQNGSNNKTNNGQKRDRGDQGSTDEYLASIGARPIT